MNEKPKDNNYTTSTQIASAPPLYPVISSGFSRDTNTFRLAEISIVMHELNNELEKYESLRKKYKRWGTDFQWSDWITATCTTISSTAAVGCLATNVLLPVTLLLVITSVSRSVLAILSTTVKNRILAKKTRNERITVLATAKMNLVSE